MTLLELIDSAVKIGLGAGIGLLGAWLARRSDSKIEQNRNQRELFLKVVEDFDAGHHKFADFLVDARAKKQAGVKVDTPISIIAEGRRGMLAAEAKLTIMGADQAAGSVRSYGDSVRNCLDALKRESPDFPASLIHELKQARADFLGALSSEYKRLV